MDRLAEVCERVASYASRLRKVQLVADYLRTLDDADLSRAVQLLAGAPIIRTESNSALFGKEEARTISVGPATLRDAYREVTGWDQVVLSRCAEEVGDSGETIGLLLHDRTRNEALSLERAEELYTAFYRARKTADKLALLKETLHAYRPLTLKYFIKGITGNFRIGLQSKMLEEAVAAAAGVPHEAVRMAENRLGNLASVALAARHGQLGSIEARLFHPMDFMLAKPLENTADLADPGNYLVEHKYDGIRSQIHVEAGHALIYTRGMEDVTRSFPEVLQQVAAVAGSAVLDGEILAWRDERALAFTVLQQRLARKKITPDLLAGIPVIFMAYDLLYRDGELLLDAPLERRRALLQQTGLLVSPQYQASTTADLDRLFSEARESGNEGLILKRRGSAYEPGRRSGTWYKVKRPYATLDVVITAAEQGHGRRATVLSDYTFGVKDGDRFLNVGKAYSGLTDAEIRELTRLLRAATLERFGRVALVRPEIVLEVAFDGVQKSPRHKSGYALRFPRIVRWRKDKTPEECDDVERVRGLYEASLR